LVGVLLSISFPGKVSEQNIKDKKMLAGTLLWELLSYWEELPITLF